MFIINISEVENSSSRFPPQGIFCIEHRRIYRSYIIKRSMSRASYHQSSYFDIFASGNYRIGSILQLSPCFSTSKRRVRQADALIKEYCYFLFLFFFVEKPSEKKKARFDSLVHTYTNEKKKKKKKNFVPTGTTFSCDFFLFISR